MISNRVQKVGLTQAWRTIKEEWVVLFGWVLSHRNSRGMGELVTCPNNKAIENITRVERALLNRTGSGRNNDSGRGAWARRAADHGAGRRLGRRRGHFKSGKRA